MMSEKIIILLIILLFFLLSIKFKNYTFESIIKRYNIRFKGKNISSRNIEDSMVIYISYAKSIKEGKVNEIIFNKNFVSPKISFIMSVFNKEKYLIHFIISIQMQDLKEIEAVFVDDFSNDKSVQIINNFRKKDKRIKLIKNKKNMGSLYSRAIGGNMAKGNYCIFFDSDDIILKEGILKAYNHILKYKLDIVQFLSIIQRNETLFTTKNMFKYKKIITQPILSHIFYYDKEGVENNIRLWDKLIAKQIVLESLKYIGKKYIQQKMMIENDVILLFALFKTAKSYQFVEYFGYYYFRANTGSITNSIMKPKNSNELIHSILTNIQFLYEKTSNTSLDKYFCVFKYKQFFKRYKNILINSKQEFNFMKNLSNILLASKYISSKDKLAIFKIYLTIFNIDGSIRE